MRYWEDECVPEPLFGIMGQMFSPLNRREKKRKRRGGKGGRKSGKDMGEARLTFFARLCAL